MQIEKNKKQKIKNLPKGICRLLLFLGTPETSFRKSQNFWLTNESRLDSIYYDAKAAYRESAKNCHPDRIGGSHEQVSLLNIAWAKVQKMFNKRGIPEKVQPIILNENIEKEKIYHEKKNSLTRYIAEKMNLSRSTVNISIYHNGFYNNRKVADKTKKRIHDFKEQLLNEQPDNWRLGRWEPLILK